MKCKKMLEAILAGTLALAGCSDPEPETVYLYPPESPMPVYSREDTNKNKLMDEGVNITSWWYNDLTGPQIKDTLVQLHSLGVESASFLTTYYQLSPSSTEIYPIGNKTPMDSGLERAISLAKQVGMKTVLKPHVDMPSGIWRGEISMNSEADWQAWFQSYNDFILHYAQLAEDNGVDMLVIGTELEKTVQRPEWTSIIANIRYAYNGDITYSANWDGYELVPFWDQLDYIGISAYFPLTNKFDPDYTELRDKWSEIGTNLDSFANSNGKQIVICETGYQDRDGTNTSPWWISSYVDEQEQADCYRAMFNSLHNRPTISGIYPWMCYFNPSQDVNGYDFFGKQAEHVINYYYHLED